MAVRLVGASTLWIFSRVDGNQLSPASAILQIKKDALSQKLEMSFGILAEGDSDIDEAESLEYKF